MKKNELKNRSLNPRIPAVLFFAIFSLLFMLVIKYALLPLEGTGILPLFSSSLVAIGIGISLGMLFGSPLIKSRSWFGAFALGLLMGNIALVIMSIRLFIYAYTINPSFFVQFQHWQDYLIFYMAILVSLYVTLGIWLLPATGIAALYYNKRFYPGFLALDKQRQETN